MGLANMFSSPPARTYALFISHAWEHDLEYYQLEKLLNTDASFAWLNLSVPEHDPLPHLASLPRSYRCLVRQLDDRISKADCVLVLAGMYCAHSGWIQSEIEAAKDHGKPIIGVAPRGQERFPDAVKQAAVETVGWNSSSIVTAVRKHASYSFSLSQLVGGSGINNLVPPGGESNNSLQNPYARYRPNR